MQKVLPPPLLLLPQSASLLWCGLPTFKSGFMQTFSGEKAGSIYEIRTVYHPQSEMFSVSRVGLLLPGDLDLFYLFDSPANKILRRCSSLSTWSARSPAVSLPLCLVGRLCLILRGQMRSDAAKVQTVLHIC